MNLPQEMTLQTPSNLPLSPNEERYVLVETMTPHVYAMPCTYRIRGKIDIARLRDALHYLCNRHEAMRTGFRRLPDGRYEKYVEAEASPALDEIDLDGGTPEAAGTALHARLFAKPDLTPGSLRRFVLIRLGADDHIFAFSHHHSISDGISLQIFARELFAYYAAPEVQAAPRQFSSFWNTDWRQSGSYEAALAHWKNALDGIDEIASLPDDKAVHGDGEPRSICLDLPEALVARAKAAASAAGVSPFAFFAGASATALARMTDEDRVCMVFQSSGRRAFGDAAAATVGPFSNALMLAPRIDGNAPARTFLRAFSSDIAAAIANEICPYHHVIQATGVHPRFGINWYPALPALNVPGLEISGPDMSDRQSDYDLNLRFVRKGAGLSLIIYHKPGISAARAMAAAEEIARLAQAFCDDLDAPVATAIARARPATDLLPDPAIPLIEGNDDLIHSAFLRAVKRAPDATAIIHQDQRFSYAEVEARSRALALKLCAAGIGRGQRVVILAEREPALIWSILAVTRAGGVFIVLDAAYPEERLTTLIGLSQPDAILANPLNACFDLAGKLAKDNLLPLIGSDDDGDDAGLDGADTPLDQAAATDPAYFLFTSGSTGTPKCVACTHAPLAHFTTWQAEHFGLTADDRFTMLSGLSHDPLMRDIFTPLSIGATIAIPQQDEIFEPGGLRRWFDEVRPSIAHMTPAMGQLLLASSLNAPEPIADLRQVFWGGDLLRPVLLADIGRIAPNARHTNFYGSTETPQAAGFFPFDGDMDWKTVPVGKGSEGFQLLVVDRDRQPKGLGEVGEIAIRSNFLSLGYVNGGAIDTPPADRGTDAEGRRNIYYTGDRGLHLPDGNVVVLGRQDDQIKVRGFRVDLSEITAALLSHPQVKHAIALAHGPETDRRIGAFVTPQEPGETIGTAALLHFLSGKLPDYMLPQSVEQLERIPLLPNGKTDRKALLNRLDADATPAPARNRRMTAAEKSIVESWSAILGRNDVSPATSFVHLGGDSLSYVQVYMATEEVLGVVPEGWQFMPISELATTGRSANRFWSVVDTSMLIRAISIVLVVSGHFQLLHYGGGATTALFLVSGFIFGGFQLNEIFYRHSARPALRLFIKVLIPTVLFCYLLFFIKYAVGKHPNPSVIFFYGNFVDYSAFNDKYRQGHEFYLWYIYCALQIILLSWISALILKWLNLFSIGRLKFALTVFAVACLARFVLTGFIFDGFFESGARSLTMENFLPTTHWASFALGAVIASTDNARQKLWVALIVAVYAALTQIFYSTTAAGFVFVFGILLLCFNRIPVPKPVNVVVFTLSGASLFIYLTHFQYRVIFEAMGLPGAPLFNVLGAIAGGILAWYVWQHLSSFVGTRLNRRTPPQEAEAMQYGTV